ncbi:exported hypothetical protein [Stenotrophomonas indicatrix]|nr:exported hypothetical protein [Stenotrophomonas indicatrix]
MRILLLLLVRLLLLLLLALLFLRCFALLFLAGMTVLLVGHDRIPRGRGKRDDRDAGAGPPWSWGG